MKISIPSAGDEGRVEKLLWQVLWKPLGFPENVRQNFKLEGSEIILWSKHGNIETGAIVAYQISPSEWELRHIAVIEEHQRSGIGAKLIRELEKRLRAHDMKRIQTIARSTSQGFFEKMGFEKIEDYPDHPNFLKHGISFTLMRKGFQ